MASQWTRTLLGTRARLLGVVGALLVLVLVVPAVLVVFGLYAPAGISVLLGVLGLAVVVIGLLPGRR